MSHLSDEQLVEIFYEESGEPAKRHLQECADCASRLLVWQERLESWLEYRVPPRSDSYGQEVWQRLVPQLRPKKGRALKVWYLAVPAIAALLTIAFFAGIWTERRGTEDSAKGRERVLLMAVSDHLERSQVILTELLHTSPGSPSLADERIRARNLLDENRLLRDTAVRVGDRRHAVLLDELQRVLTEFANSGPGESPEDFRSLQQRVESNGLLWKLQITCDNARQRGQRL